MACAEKKAEQIEVMLGLDTLGDIVSGGGPDPPTSRGKGSGGIFACCKE